MSHVNYRRKNRYDYEGYFWGIEDYWWYKRQYWKTERAKARELMVHGRFDDLQDRHPRSIFWSEIL